MVTIAKPKSLPNDAGGLAIARALFRNPAEAWLEKAYFEPYYKVPFLGRHLIYVSDPEIVEIVLLRRQKDFPKGPVEKRILRSVTGEGLFSVDGAVWKHQRRASSAVFRQSYLDALVPIMALSAQESAKRIRSTLGNGSFDIHQEMISATFLIIHHALLAGGEGIIDAESTSRDLEIILNSVGKPDPIDLLGLPPEFPRPWGRQARRAVKRIKVSAQKCIDHRRNNPSRSKDLLQLLLETEDPETGRELSNVEVRDNLLTFIAAGHETTALALTWAFYLLACYPEWQSKIRAEVRRVNEASKLKADDIQSLVLTQQVLREAMRLYPPAPAIDRIAMIDIKVGSLEIRRGDFVIIGILPMHRHESLWQDPQVFDPARFSKEHTKSRHRFSYLPFSAGPRICIGAQFAMMEATVILASLVQEFQFALETTCPIELVSSVTLRPKGGLQVMARKATG